MSKQTTADDALASNSELVALRIINRRMEDIVKQEEDVDYRHSRSNQRTQVIGRAAMIAMLFLTPPIFYLIWTLVGAMGVITDRMNLMHAEVDAMQQDFDRVAARVSNITTAVGQMRDSIQVIAPMDSRLQGMRTDIDAIAGAMGSISPDVGAIGQTIVGIDHDMAEMNQAFGFLNRDMFIMRRNVNQMSSPMRMMPFFGQ